MTAVPNSPPAPVGQQAPPARAAASAVGARRVARGSLLLTTGTASCPYLINERSRCHALDLNQNRKHHPTYDPRRLRQVAGFRSEPWPASSRNGWPASYWNAWPASSESAIDLETLAELDIRAGDDLLEQGLALKQG
jgi:hypothetical protein